MSPFRVCFLVLVLASVPPCGAFTVLSAVRSAALADDTALSRGGLDVAYHSESHYKGKTLRYDGAPPVYIGSVPVGVELLVAFTWVGLVACAPLLLRYLDRRPMTAAMVAAAGAFWVGTFVGMYLFTNVVLFRSAHFDGARPLTVIECVYFMSQVITTVGYGDITPASPDGQALVGCYVLCALLVIALLFCELVEHVQGVTRRYEEHAAAREETGREIEEVLAAVAEKSATHRRLPSPRPLVSSLLYLGLFSCSWVLFFRFWPGEEKTWTDALFMSLITLSTVGFGAVTPATEAGMIFAAFWMLFGGAALAGVVADCASLVACLKKVEHRESKAWGETFVRFSASLNGEEVTEADFIRWGLMQQGIVAEDDLGDIKQTYSHLAHHRDIALHRRSIVDERESSDGLVFGSGP